MKNEFVGDKGDFGKYLLLREICDSTNIKLPRLQFAVVWCKNDGFVEIPEEYMQLNEELFDSLQRISARISSIALIEQCHILPTHLFHEAPWTRLTRNERYAWVTNAIELSGDAPVVFLDPDIGIATETQRKNDAKKSGPTTKRSPQHIYVDELLRFFNKGKSLIVYQHRDHTALSTQVDSLATRLRGGNLNTDLSALLWEDRLFIPIWNPAHVEFQRNWLAFIQSPLTKCDGPFTEVPIQNAHHPNNRL